MEDDDFLDVAARLLADREVTAGEPAFTLLMHRGFPTYTESMWINAYPSTKTIVVTLPSVLDMPGCIREIGVGWRDLASPDALRARFEAIVHSYEQLGWVAKQAGHVYSADPWDMADVADDKPNF